MLPSIRNVKFINANVYHHSLSYIFNQTSVEWYGIALGFVKRSSVFHFSDKGVNDVVKISGMRSLTAFTACFWMNFSCTQETPISYAVSYNDNELLIECDGSFDFLIGGTQR